MEPRCASGWGKGLVEIDAADLTEAFRSYSGFVPLDRSIVKSPFLGEDPFHWENFPVLWAWYEFPAVSHALELAPGGFDPSVCVIELERFLVRSWHHVLVGESCLMFG